MLVSQIDIPLITSLQDGRNVLTDECALFLGMLFKASEINGTGFWEPKFQQTTEEVQPSSVSSFSVILTKTEASLALPDIAASLYSAASFVNRRRRIFQLHWQVVPRSCDKPKDFLRREIIITCAVLHMADRDIAGKMQIIFTNLC
jgi:hypothetical protein